LSIAFVGGWATVPGQFPWFAENSEFIVPFADFNPSDLHNRLREIAGRKKDKVLLGWSTGAHILIKECVPVFSSFDKVILVSPFLSFLDSFPERVVESMIQGLSDDFESVIRQFHLNCGESSTVSASGYNLSELRSGLNFLIDSKIKEIGCKGENLILIRGTKDRIVRKKAFEKVRNMLPEAEVLTPCTGHKPDESFLVSMVGGN
jgi:hypothetical protein